MDQAALCRTNYFGRPLCPDQFSLIFLNQLQTFVFHMTKFTNNGFAIAAF